MQEKVDPLNPSVSSRGDIGSEPVQSGAEETCVRLEDLVHDALVAVKALTTSLKKLEGAAKDGDFHEIRKSSEACMTVGTRLKATSKDITHAAQFDLKAALSSGSYTAEVLGAARTLGLAVHAQGNLIFCFPQIVRVLPEEGAIEIGKRRDSRLRPSELVKRLQQEQRKPLRLKPQQFLQLLYKVYLLALPNELPKVAAGFVVALARIYDLLTIFPGTSKEYSIEEFSRDLYLLDKSGFSTTKENAVLSFSASSGARTTADRLAMVTETGAEIVYYGISFMTTPTSDEL